MKIAPYAKHCICINNIICVYNVTYKLKYKPCVMFLHWTGVFLTFLKNKIHFICWVKQRQVDGHKISSWSVKELNFNFIFSRIQRHKTKSDICINDATDIKMLDVVTDVIWSVLLTFVLVMLCSDAVMCLNVFWLKEKQWQHSLGGQLHLLGSPNLL